MVKDITLGRVQELRLKTFGVLRTKAITDSYSLDLNVANLGQRLHSELDVFGMIKSF